MKQDHSIVLLPLRSIRTDQAIQQREGILNNAVVAEYAEAMQSGATFPAVVVFHDAETHWLADGYHRVEAADEAGLKEIKAEIREGTKRDAILFAVSANRDHGLRRTRADVRRAITTLVTDAEWGQMANRVIAEKVGCSPTTVGTIRDDLSRCENPATEEGQDQVSKLDTCDDQHPDIEEMEGDDLAGIRQATAMIKGEAPSPPARRTGRDGKSYPAPKAKPAPKPTVPTTKPTPPSAPAKPKASPALVAMRQAHAVKDALVMVARVEGDLLPEDGHTLMANLRAALERLEARFGGEVRADA